MLRELRHVVKLKILDIINNFFAWLGDFLDGIPFINDGNFTEDIKDIINIEIVNVFTQFGSDIISQIPSFIKSIITTLPKMLIILLSQSSLLFILRLIFIK